MSIWSDRNPGLTCSNWMRSDWACRTYDWFSALSPLSHGLWCSCMVSHLDVIKAIVVMGWACLWLVTSWRVIALFWPLFWTLRMPFWAWAGLVRLVRCAWKDVKVRRGRSCAICWQKESGVSLILGVWEHLPWEDVGVGVPIFFIDRGLQKYVLKLEGCFSSDLTYHSWMLVFLVKTVLRITVATTFDLLVKV